MKKLIAMLLALVMVFSMVACSNDQTVEPENTDNHPEQSTPVDTQPEQSADPVPSEPVEEVNNEVVEYYMQKANEVEVTDTHVIFTDDGSGEKLSIAKNPKNAAILYGSLGALWYEAGGTVQLAIGGKSAVTLYKEQIGRDITQDEGVKVVTDSSSGTNWDVEAILAEKPDLIVTSVGMKGYTTISGPAAAIGVPVIGINYDGVQDYLKWFKVFCNLNGHPELWEEVAENTANKIIEIISKLPENVDAPTAAILVVSSDKLKAYTYDSQAGSMLVELGGINVFDRDNEGASSSIEISLEDLYQQDPDIIFLAWYNEPGEMYDQLMSMVEGNPVWDSLRANKEGRFIQLDKSLFHNKANKLYDQAYLTLAQHLYPDTEF
jgi:ABC-type Fe3+-hydroxamate transport system substrate-binding protein